MKKKALIIGTGLGGLATALRLHKHGYEVEMVEKYKQAGGRLNQLKKDGFTFDLGPSFFSMSYEFQEFIKDVGIQMPFEFIELNPLYTINFAGSKRNFVIYKDLERLSKQFDGLETDFAGKMEKYLQAAGNLFHDTENLIIKRNFDSYAAFLLSMSRVPWKHAPKMMRSMWSELDRHFDSYEAKVIFSLVAFFLGATPFDTPAVYSLLSYTELKHDGYYNVKGGMYKIVEGLLEEIKKRDIQIHYNTEIKSFDQENGKVTGFVDQNGKKWTADVFVANADAASFRGEVMQRPKYNEQKLDKQKWTLAPFTMYLGVKGKVDSLDHHNYFLGNNFEDYAGKIFKNSISLDKPYYYVNVNSRYNDNVAPEGHENLFILCPVPDLRFKKSWEDREQLAENILTDLSERIGFDLVANRVSQTILDPADWQNMFNLYKGSGLGLAHDLNQIGAFRPANNDEKFPNLYYVGASTVPGTGLPMVIISSNLVTKRIVKQHGSIHA